jgi:hypothetical protein
MWTPAIVVAFAVALSACSPAPRIETATPETPEQVVIVGDPIAGPVAMPAASATAQERCRQYGRHAQYVGITDTGSFWREPVLSRVFDCVDWTRSEEPALPARRQ